MKKIFMVVGFIVSFVNSSQAGEVSKKSQPQKGLAHTSKESPLQQAMDFLPCDSKAAVRNSTVPINSCALVRLTQDYCSYVTNNKNQGLKDLITKETLQKGSRKSECTTSETEFQTVEYTAQEIGQIEELLNLFCMTDPTDSGPQFKLSVTFPHRSAPYPIAQNYENLTEMMISEFVDQNMSNSSDAAAASASSQPADRYYFLGPREICKVIVGYIVQKWYKQEYGGPKYTYVLKTILPKDQATNTVASASAASESKNSEISSNYSRPTYFPISQHLQKGSAQDPQNEEKLFSMRAKLAKHIESALNDLSNRYQYVDDIDENDTDKDINVIVVAKNIADTAANAAAKSKLEKYFEKNPNSKLICVFNDDEEVIPDYFGKGMPSTIKNIAIVGNNIKIIGSCFLYQCKKLEKIDLSALSKVTSVEENFLKACEKLEEIDLSPFSKITSMPSGFLFSCSKIQKIDLRPLSNVISIGSNCFAHCSKIQKIDLSSLSKVTSIGMFFFAGCSSFEEIDLSPLSNVRSIGDHLLCECYNLRKIDLSTWSKVTSIGKYFLISFNNIEEFKISRDLWNLILKQCDICIVIEKLQKLGNGLQIVDSTTSSLAASSPASAGSASPQQQQTTALAALASAASAISKYPAIADELKNVHSTTYSAAASSSASVASESQQDPDTTASSVVSWSSSTASAAAAPAVLKYPKK